MSVLDQMRPQDWFTAGVLVTLWLSGRARRDQGKRIGSLEQDVRELLSVVSPKRALRDLTSDTPTPRDRP